MKTTLLLLFTLATVTLRAAPDFPTAMNEMWKTGNASNIIHFAEINAATNRTPETLFARGVVALGLQSWARGGVAFLREASAIAATNTAYTATQRALVITTLTLNANTFLAIAEDSGEPTDSNPKSDPQHQAAILSELGGEFPFLHELQFIARARTTTWPDHAAFESVAIRALANKETLISPIFTETLSAFIATTADTNDWATATLILSIAQMKQFEETLDLPLFEQTFTTLSNLIHTASESSQWQKHTARLLLAGCYSLDGKDQQAYTIATNALAIIRQAPIPTPKDPLWEAIWKNQTSSDFTLTPLQTAQLSAAFSAAMLGHHKEARAYTRDLPEKWKKEIEEFIAEIEESNKMEP